MNQPANQPTPLPAPDMPPDGDTPSENPQHEPMIEPDGDPAMDPIRDDPAEVVQASLKQTSKQTLAEMSANYKAVSAKPQPTSTPVSQAGEGSYEGTRDYAKSIADYTKQANQRGGAAAVVEANARAAAPKTAAEANEIGRAEKEAASRTRAPGR